MRILLIFILSFMLFNAPVYAVRPFSKEEIEESTEEETISSEVEEEREEIKREKKRLMEEIASSREEREKNLHPFVYKTPPEVSEGDVEPRPAHYVVKGFISPTPGKETSRPSSSGQSLIPKHILNFIFFSIIVIAFLVAYYFIHPKSK